MNANSFLLLADPTHPIFKTLIEKSCHNLSFYYENQIISYTGISKSPVTFNPSLAKVVHELTFDELLARQLLTKYETCLNRWNKSFLSDSTCNSLIESIRTIYVFAVTQKCRAAIFLTASPHHVSTIVLDVACCMAKVERIFLYPVVFSRRLLPITKFGAYQDSSYQYFESALSKYDSLHDLLDFKDRCKKRLLPQTNQLIRSSKSDLFISILGLALLNAKQIFKSLLPLNALRLTKKSLPRRVNEIVPKYILDSHYKTNLISRVSAVCRQLLYNKKLNEMIKKNTSTNRVIRPKLAVCIYPGIEPESTTAPEGGVFDSIASLSIALRKKFPEITIFYKEHPNVHSIILDNQLSMAGYYRNNNFLRLLVDLNIYPVSNEYLKLIGKEIMILPITLTGTIAIERSLLGLQTIVAGQPYYGLDMPGVLPLCSFNHIDCLNAINQKSISENAFNYLSALLNSKCIDNPFGIGSGITNKPSPECIDEYLNLLNTIASNS